MGALRWLAQVPLLSRKPALERACERMAIIAGGSAPWASESILQLSLRSTAASAMTKARQERL